MRIYKHRCRNDLQNRLFSKLKQPHDGEGRSNTTLEAILLRATLLRGSQSRFSRVPGAYLAGAGVIVVVVRGLVTIVTVVIVVAVVVLGNAVSHQAFADENRQPSRCKRLGGKPQNLGCSSQFHEHLCPCDNR
jgi:hypothetical protein